MKQPLPHSPAAGNSTTANGLPKFNLHMVFSALRCWWHIALPLGLVLGSCAAVAVYYTTTPTYTAEAWLMIHERQIQLLPGAPPDDPRKFVANQIELMRSPPVLDPVIADREVRSAPELADEEDPGLFLRNHLLVEAQGDSDYFVVKFTSADPAKAARIANAVAKSYLSLQESRDSKVHDLMIEVLQEQLRARETDIQSIRKRLEERTKELTGKSAFPVQGREKDVPNRSKFQELESQLLTAQIAEVTLGAQIKAEQELFARESFDPPEELVLARVKNDPKFAGLENSLASNREKLAAHKEVSTNLSKNPAYQKLERVIEDDQSALKKLSEELIAQFKMEMANMARMKRQAEIFELEADLVRVLATKSFLEQQLQGERKDQEEASGDTLQLEFEWADFQQASNLRDAISSRIISMQIERRAPERVSMFREAAVPVRADEEVPFKNMLVAALAALAVPFGLAVGIEVLFQRVGSRQQLELTGGIMVVGEITNLPRRIKSRRQQAEPHRDVQLYEESINGLRTYLTLIESARGRRVLAVTSSISREGKTSLAAQLAVSVANSSGKPTLLIDGDMRSPDLHRIFGVDCGPGLADVLAGECPVEEAIETSFSSRLHVLTAGQLSVNPHQLTGSGEFEQLIEKLRAMYDHIIIDTPPILPASEALRMARAADAAILCVRRDYSRVDQVSEAHARLVAAGVKVAGAVLNGVPSQAYAFRYGSYYYTKAQPSGPQAPSNEPTIVA